ncbi:Pentatricopeptide repeat-containing protein [Artemisia annua]|uniref:RNA-dependent RNA polymerase n=1 Tax=Artemisia annua TaxID=35608 RepID=A0A2U1NA63_ARTAN|nr:Pentatricopeptide repeat-containing protein [Artemisia annua]
MGDVQVLKAVDVPALLYMVDCVVFPHKGQRQVEPMDYIPAPSIELDRNVTIQKFWPLFASYYTSFLNYDGCVNTTYQPPDEESDNEDLEPSHRGEDDDVKVYVFPDGLHVLAVDDDPTCLLMSNKMLELCKYKATQSQLTNFINIHLKNNPTPHDLLSFLKNHLHHHPKFAHLDLHVFRHAATLDSFRHDHSTYEWMVRTLAITHRLDSLSSLLDFIVSNPCPCSDGIFSCSRTEPIFRFAINSFCNVGRFDDAIHAFDSMRKLVDGKPNVAIYNNMIHSFVKYDKFEKGLEFYGRMIKDRVKPDVVTFNILINGYFRSSKFGLALEVFKEMRVKGCVPNVITFNTLIKGFFRESKYKEGIGMAYEMIELGCGLSSVTCDILVDGLTKEGMVSEACDIVLDFSRKGVLPTKFDYFDLIDRLCDKGNVIKAGLMVDEIWEKGNAPSPITCTILIEGFRRVGNTDSALKLMDKMLKESIVPDSVTFNCLLGDLCKSGRTMEANTLRMLASKKGVCIDEVTYNILVSGYSKEGKKTEGKAIVDEMLDNDVIPDIFAYNRLIKRLGIK